MCLLFLWLWHLNPRSIEDPISSWPDCSPDGWRPCVPCGHSMHLKLSPITRYVGSVTAHFQAPTQDRFVHQKLSWLCCMCLTSAPSARSNCWLRTISAGPENVSVRRTLSVSALEVLYGIALYKLTFTYLLTYLLTYLFKYKLFIKILSSSLNTILIINKHCSDICCDEFPMPQIDHKSNKIKRTITWKILFAISMRKDSLFLTPKISKFVDE